MLIDADLLALTVRLEFNIEMRERLAWMENIDDEVFLRSTRILFAGDITDMLEGVPKNFDVPFTVVDVDNPIDFRLSSISLFLIFSLIVLSNCALFGVFSGWLF